MLDSLVVGPENVDSLVHNVLHCSRSMLPFDILQMETDRRREFQ
jgi:hypothetical protein